MGPGRRVGIDHAQLVVAGVAEEVDDRFADLAGAEQGKAGHGGLPSGILGGILGARRADS
jgi:hypothetical protein